MLLPAIVQHLQQHRLCFAAIAGASLTRASFIGIHLFQLAIVRQRAMHFSLIGLPARRRSAVAARIPSPSVFPTRPHPMFFQTLRRDVLVIVCSSASAPYPQRWPATVSLRRHQLVAPAVHDLCVGRWRRRRIPAGSCGCRSCWASTFALGVHRSPWSPKDVRWPLLFHAQLLHPATRSERRKCAADCLPATGRNGWNRGRPDDRNGRATGCRCAAIRAFGADHVEPPAAATLAWRCCQRCGLFRAGRRVGVQPSAFNSACRLPPRTMSVPRPAMLVAMVTVPAVQPER